MNDLSVNIIQSMNKKLLMIIGVLAFAGTSANAGWFGAAIKPVPYIKVPFVKLAVPCPSGVVGPRAGTEADAKVSSQGASAALPWIRAAVRWPSLTLGEGKNTVTLGPKGAKPSPKNKSKGERKKAK